MTGVKDLAAKAAEFIRPRQKLVLICLGGCAALLILVLAFLVAGISRNLRSPRVEQDLSEVFSPRAIPREEFFLPAEPDFLPEVMLERERRESWSAEDAHPFWSDPLDAGAGEYTDLMSRVIDDLMERIP